jgi:outer membrane receptor for ferric coprogen and ferric-rhodotorulic acid
MKLLPHRQAVAVLGLIVISAFALLPLRVVAAVPNDAAKKSFDVPAGDAPHSLKQFAQQSGLELLYSTKEIAGATTNAVKGVFHAA